VRFGTIASQGVYARDEEEETDVEQFDDPDETQLNEQSNELPNEPPLSEIDNSDLLELDAKADINADVIITTLMNNRENGSDDDDFADEVINELIAESAAEAAAEAAADHADETDGLVAEAETDDAEWWEAAAVADEDALIDDAPDDTADEEVNADA
jgi:hypothetical protein